MITLQKALQKALLFVGNDVKRIDITGVRLECEKGLLYVTACTAHALYCAEVQADYPDFSVTITQDFAKAITKDIAAFSPSSANQFKMFSPYPDWKYIIYPDRSAQKSKVQSTKFKGYLKKKVALNKFSNYIPLYSTGIKVFENGFNPRKMADVRKVITTNTMLEIHHLYKKKMVIKFGTETVVIMPESNCVYDQTLKVAKELFYKLTKGVKNG